MRKAVILPVTALVMSVGMTSCHPSAPVDAVVTPSDGATRCSALAPGDIAGGSIVKTELVAEKTGGPTKSTPAHCAVSLKLKPSADSDINVLIWLPASGWNGRFQGVGNGGFAGNLNTNDMAMAVRRGFAAATTDTGHGLVDPAVWAKDHPERIIDYAYRGIHLAAVAAKIIIARYYGEGPRHSYFSACSNGGRQAVMEASRYPEDYDGIIAGAPAVDFTGLVVASFGWNAAVMHQTPISAAKAPALADAVMKQCDALDGVTDGVIADPRACHFDPSVLLCKAGETDQCFTAAQIDALKKIYQGPTLPDGTNLMPGFSPGGEKDIAPSQGWGLWIFGTPSAPAIEQSFLNKFEVNFISGNDAWTVGSFDLARDYGRAMRDHGAALNADNPDLQAFAKRGGKLLIYHGWSDPAIPPLSSVKYVGRVRAAMGSATDKFLRLFMIPGMQHCWMGESPWFANPLAAKSPAEPDRDMAAAMQRWVEEGVAPEQLVTVRPVNPLAPIIDAPEIPITREGLICAWPKTAKYDGVGDVKKAASYRCTATR